MDAIIKSLNKDIAINLNKSTLCLFIKISYHILLYEGARMNARSNLVLLLLSIRSYEERKLQKSKRLRFD